MSNLFVRSKARFDLAAAAWKHKKNDEGYLELVCFDVQQSMEFTLKYILECNGIKYPRTHDIKRLIKLLEEEGNCPNEVKALKENADDYTKWEADSRYDDDFMETVSVIDDALTKLRTLIKYTESTYEQRPYIDDAALQWCLDNAPEALKQVSREELLELMLPIYKSQVLTADKSIENKDNQ